MLRCMILSYVWRFATWSSDGARCYPPLCKNHSLKHFACSHRKNQFVRKVRRHGNKTLEVHTGTIDSCWGMLKKTYLPSWPLVLRTKKNGMNWFGHMSELGSGAGRQHLLDLLCWKKQAITCPRWTSNRLRVLKLGFWREKTRCPANIQVRNLIKIQ